MVFHAERSEITDERQSKTANRKQGRVPLIRCIVWFGEGFHPSF